MSLSYLSKPTLSIEPVDELADEPLYHFWRAECSVYLYDDESDVSVYYAPYRIVKRTPRGVWLRHHYDNDTSPPSYKNGAKFVLLGTYKAFAYPTRREALVSLKKRQAHRLSYAQATMTRAQAAFNATRNL